MSCTFMRNRPDLEGQQRKGERGAAPGETANDSARVEMQDVSRRTRLLKTRVGGPRPRPGIGRVEGPEGMATRAPGDDNPTSHVSGSRSAVVCDVAQECIITSRE